MRRNILRVFVVTVTANGLALVAGPLLGLAVLFFENGTIALIDVISSIVYVAVLPYAAVVQTLLYFDVRRRETERAAAATAPVDAAPAAT